MREQFQVQQVDHVAKIQLRNVSPGTNCVTMDKGVSSRRNSSRFLTGVDKRDSGLRSYFLS